MSQHIRKIDAFRYQAWTEGFNRDSQKFETVCEAIMLDDGEGFLIETISTPPEHRRKGYAKALVEKIISLGRPVRPIMVEDTEEAISFWTSLGMKDALGERHDD